MSCWFPSRFLSQSWQCPPGLGSKPTPLSALCALHNTVYFGQQGEMQWRNLWVRYPRLAGGGPISAKICVFIRGFRLKIDKVCEDFLGGAIVKIVFSVGGPSQSYATGERSRGKGGEQAWRKLEKNSEEATLHLGVCNGENLAIQSNIPNNLSQYRAS